ncbi:hypothetical protein ATCC90586_002364 [Pythium insidiosum]|nr:hypothetical protein ATCC90586_002364 [Pythium insidiosum]
MSNGLHQVAPASFFPTAKELSSGLQWFKDHPILAAAAATAVSVITYLNTADEMGDDTVELDIATGRGGAVGKHVDGADDYERAPRRRRDSDPTASSSSASAACPKPTITRQLSAGSRVTPPALRKPGSDGRISSPAAVSWVDEHGGELTQVFEHLTVDDDEREHSRFPDLDGPPRAPRCDTSRVSRPPTHPRRATDQTVSPRTAQCRNSVAEDATSDASIEETLSNHGAKTSVVTSPGNGAQSPLLPQAESPQWGWYVAITPPQDQHSCHANLPRAVPQPPSRLPCGGDLKPTRSPTGIADRPNASAPTHGACGAGDPTPPAIAAAQSTSTAMRRSTSGRIQG